MKKFYLKHLTTYKYSNNVTESNNKIHLYPYNDLNQQIVEPYIGLSIQISTCVILVSAVQHYQDYNNHIV